MESGNLDLLALVRAVGISLVVGSILYFVNEKRAEGEKPAQANGIYTITAEGVSSGVSRAHDLLLWSRPVVRVYERAK